MKRQTAYIIILSEKNSNKNIYILVNILTKQHKFKNHKGNLLFSFIYHQNNFKAFLKLQSSTFKI